MNNSDVTEQPTAHTPVACSAWLGLMWMTNYIREIQKLLITKYGFKAGDNGCPQDVPDGEYPMNIEGKRDNVRIVAGKISCCNFEA